MHVSHRFRVCAGALLLGASLSLAPLSAQELVRDEVAVGTASLQRSTEQWAKTLQALPEKHANELQATDLQELGKYGPLVMRDYEGLMVATEVMVVQTLLLAADRVSMEGNPAIATVVQQRIQNHFGIGAAEVTKLRALQLAWSETILGLAIAKLTNKKVEGLLQQAKEGKPWTDIAREAGMPHGKLGGAVEKLFKE